MSDFKEEAYVLEKMEISEDEDDGFEYNEIKASEEDVEDTQQLEPSVMEDEDDLNDFYALKTKTDLKKMEATKAQGGVVIEDRQPKTLTREVVIDDFIRNFMQKFKMNKTLNVF